MTANKSGWSAFNCGFGPCLEKYFDKGPPCRGIIGNASADTGHAPQDNSHFENLSIHKPRRLSALFQSQLFDSVWPYRRSASVLFGYSSDGQHFVMVVVTVIS
jgi:hypothetical protein